MLPHCPCAFLTLFILTIHMFRPCRYGCPCQNSLGRLEDVITSVFPGLSATQNLKIPFCLSAHTWTSTGTWAFRQSCSTWNTHTNETMDSSSWSKLTWYQADKLVTWLVNYIHFLLLSFQVPRFLFLQLVWFLSLEVKYKSCSERVRNAHVKTVCFAFQCLHSWGFPVTK